MPSETRTSPGAPYSSLPTATEKFALALDISTARMQALRPWYPRSYRVTNNVRDIERIFDDGISVCIWRRAPDPRIQEYLANLQPHGEVERVERIQVSQPDLDSLLRDFPNLPGRSDFQLDLQGVIDLFATLTDSKTVGVRLLVTRLTPCPRFHVDRVGLRSICTWQGQATEWLDYQAVNREFLGLGSAPRDEPSGLLVPGAQIHRMRTFDIGIFKGERWPNNAGRGAVHRSPAPGERWRVMVSLDELD